MISDTLICPNVPLTANSVSSLTGKPNGEGSIASFFGRVNYNYQEKYMASVIMRADGSSTFARGHRWGYFPSVSAGWVISNESFMSGIKWLDFLAVFPTAWVAFRYRNLVGTVLFGVVLIAVLRLVF